MIPLGLWNYNLSIVFWNCFDGKVFVLLFIFISFDHCII